MPSSAPSAGADEVGGVLGGVLELELDPDDPTPPNGNTHPLMTSAVAVRPAPSAMRFSDGVEVRIPPVYAGNTGTPRAEGTRSSSDSRGRGPRNEIVSNAGVYPPVATGTKVRRK